MSDERAEWDHWSPEAAEALRASGGLHRFAVAWMLRRLTEVEKGTIRRGTRETSLQRLLADMDRPTIADDFRDLLDLTQCLATGPAVEPELGRWAAGLPSDPPSAFFPCLRAWLGLRGLMLAEEAEHEAADLWEALTGSAAARDFFKMRERLERLRKTPPEHYSVAEKCATHDFPELVELAAGGGYGYSLTLREFLVRRLVAWCRRHCRTAAPVGSVHPRLARWTDEDRAEVMRLLQPGKEHASEGPAERKEEEEIREGRRATILVVAGDKEVAERLRKIAGQAPTPANNDVRRYDRPEDVVCDVEGPCVIAVPGPNDDPAETLSALQQRLKGPRVIVLLPEDNLAKAWHLLYRGAYDIAWHRAFSVRHLRQAVAHAANGARRPPYAPVFPDTHARNCDLRPTRWATVCPEDVSCWTNESDCRALRLLPRCLSLGAEAVAFQEVLAPHLLKSPEAPGLVLALLSAQPRLGSDRAAFLAAMHDLESGDRCVLYLQRYGAAMPADLAGGPAVRRSIRYHSAVELLLRLYFGFGGIPALDRATESCDHDASQRTL